MIWADEKGWAVWSQRSSLRGNICLETGIMKKETAILSVKSFPAELVRKSKGPCRKIPTNSRNLMRYLELMGKL